MSNSLPIEYHGQTGDISFDHERYNIRIHFTVFPEYELRESMKLIGWRYYSPEQFWYIRYSEDNYSTAKAIVGIPEEVEDLSCNEPEMCLDVHDVLVVTSISKCIHKEHDISKGRALVPVLRNGIISEVPIPVLYCETCDCYFVMENDYYTVKKRGILCCHVLSRTEFAQYNQLKDWAPISLMRSYGYCVNREEDIPRDKRHEIIAFLIENDIMGALEIDSFLSWLIRKNARKSFMDIAISKWEDDRQYARTYVKGNFTIRVNTMKFRNR